MKVRVVTALVFGFPAVWVGTAADAGPCARNSSSNCLNLPATINFNSVPEISNKIVDEEKIKQAPLKNPAEGSSKTPYTGPIIGTSPRPGRTPTVGYYWSLD
jgi:hypothetical protein